MLTRYVQRSWGPCRPTPSVMQFRVPSGDGQSWHTELDPETSSKGAGARLQILNPVRVTDPSEIQRIGVDGVTARPLSSDACHALPWNDRDPTHSRSQNRSVLNSTTRSRVSCSTVTVHRSWLPWCPSTLLSVKQAPLSVTWQSPDTEKKAEVAAVGLEVVGEVVGDDVVGEFEGGVAVGEMVGLSEHEGCATRFGQALLRLHVLK